MGDGTPPAGRGIIDRYRQIANEVAEFAKDEAVASGLPGAFGGPQDAYRHIIASAELTRRIGLPGIAIMKANEANSWWADLMDRISGRQRHASNRPDARAMDRTNNNIGAPIGITAESTEDVVRRARQRIEAAQHWGGTGHDFTPVWFESRRWDAPASTTAWPVVQWPSLDTSPHFAAYAGRHAPSAYRGGRAPDEDARCPVVVSPHLRRGHPVQGYLRRCADEVR